VWASGTCTLANGAGSASYIRLTQSSMTLQTIDNNGAGGPAFRTHIHMNSSGVGINTTTPSSALHVIGDAIISGNVTINGTLNGSAPGSGSSSVSFSANTYYSVSGYNRLYFGDNGSTYVVGKTFLYQRQDGANMFSVGENGNVSVTGNMNLEGGSLTVNGKFSYTYPTSGYQINTGGGTFNTTSSTVDVAIKANGAVWSTDRFLVVSDERIKKNIKPVTNSLDVINKLNIVSFDHIDFMKEPVKHGLIAQEVQKVYPEAVGVQKDYIPSVFRLGTYEKNDENVKITSPIPHGFVVNDNIKLYISKDNILDKEDTLYQTNILEVISETEFIVKSWDNFSLDKMLFIYGKMVNDFLGIDKPLIGVLAAGACKILSEQVSTLQQENLELRSTMNAILQKYPV
jgi:hypothetical protein